jgi:hypothetical protein
VYKEQVAALVKYFLETEHFIFQPPVVNYYKKSNVGEDFMNDVNFKKTINKTDILMCSTYLSVGVDILDKFDFNIYFNEIWTPQEIEQFANRLRSHDLFIRLYLNYKDADGVPLNISKYTPCNFKLSDDEINAKVKEAEQYAEEDKKRKEEVEVKNQAETLIYETEKNIKELDQALSEDEKNDINGAKDALQKALEAGNIDDIKAKTEALTEKFHTISAKMYEKAQQAQAAQQGASMGQNPNMGNMGQQPGADQQNAGNDNVVDADFEVVDDEN